MSQPASAPRIPSLRFPEFSGEWYFGSISNLVESLDAGVSVNSVDEQGIENDKAILKTSCVTNGFFDSKEHKKVVDETEISRLKESVKAETIIISRMNTPNLVGANAYVEKDFPNLFLPDRLWAAKISKKASPRWVSFLTSSPKTRAVMSSRATGTSDSMKNITKSDVMELPVFFPTLPEQTKIAAFLSSVDSKIDQLSQKKALLEHYKKGVMQQIFSQQIRFKADDGSDYPEWEEKRLGEVAKIYQPKTISQTDLTDDGYDVYGANGVIGKYHSYNHEFSQIAVTCRGNTCGTVNFTKPMSWITGNAMVINLDDSSSSNKLFFYHQLSNSNLAYLITGSGQPQITGDIKNHIVQVPLVSEQTKIAHFLTAIDSKIEQVAQQLEAAKQFKKGLLQQMFV